MRKDLRKKFKKYLESKEEMTLLGDVDFIDVEKRISFGMGPMWTSSMWRNVYPLGWGLTLLH